jgi:hypothetical protein
MDYRPLWSSTWAGVCIFSRGALVASNNPLHTISGIRDNYRRGSVGEFLKQKIRSGSALSVVFAYFTIYAFDKLKLMVRSFFRGYSRIDHSLPTF